VNSLPHLLNDLGRESLEVAWVAARDQALIDYHCLIDPIGPGILHVGCHGMVGGHLATLGEPCLDQDPRGVTNRCHRLPAIVEIPDEGNGVLVGTQQIGIDLTAGNDQRVIFIDLDRIDGAVDGDRIAPIVAIPAPNLSGLERNDVDLGTGLLEPPP
jgi:hypothetical protein